MKELDEHLDQHDASRDAAESTTISVGDNDVVQAFKGALIAHAGNVHTAESLMTVTWQEH